MLVMAHEVDAFFPPTCQTNKKEKKERLGTETFNSQVLNNSTTLLNYPKDCCVSVWSHIEVIVNVLYIHSQHLRLYIL